MGIPGILSPEGGIVGFFSGEAGPTSNRNGKPFTINFLDGVSAPDPTSNTAMLLSHLYQFFGSLLGCSAAGFPPYEGDPDMYRVHKFMNATDELNTFVITQLGLSASAMGMTNADATKFETLLDTLFGTRCAAPLKASDGVPPFLVGTNPSICTADDCPLAPAGNCNDKVPTKAPAKAPTKPLPKLTGLDLYNANSNKKIATLTNGISVFLPNCLPQPPALNVVATFNSNSEPKVESVVFAFKGNSRYRTEAKAAYALCGNNGDDIFSCGSDTLGCGAHTVTATPYAGVGGTGLAGAPVTIKFSITGCL